jgi:hypothetical protein
MALLAQVALVSQTTRVKLADLTRVAAALQRQVTRDFGPIWNVQATVSAFALLKDVPNGYWPIIIRTSVEGAAGYHSDKDGQPFSLVGLSGSWTLTASHECLEMLGDPFGSRLIAGKSPAPKQGRVEFLVEVCDPSEADKFAYTVNGVTVSDFYTPRYFDPVTTSSVQYSFTGAIKAPRQVLDGGYLSWHDPVTDHWFQLRMFGSRQIVDLGRLERQAKESLRGMIDRVTTPDQLAYKRTREASAELAASFSTAASDDEQASIARAEALEKQIDALLGPPEDN